MVVVVLVVGSVAWVGATVATVGSASVAVDRIVVVAGVPTARRLVVVVRTTRFLVLVVTFFDLDDDVAAVASEPSVGDSDTATMPTMAVIAAAANRVSFRSRTDEGVVRRNMGATLLVSDGGGKDHSK